MSQRPWLALFAAQWQYGVPNKIPAMVYLLFIFRIFQERCSAKDDWPGLEFNAHAINRQRRELRNTFVRYYFVQPTNRSRLNRNMIQSVENLSLIFNFLVFLKYLRDNGSSRLSSNGKSSKSLFSPSFERSSLFPPMVLSKVSFPYPQCWLSTRCLVSCVGSLVGERVCCPVSSPLSTMSRSERSSISRSSSAVRSDAEWVYNSIAWWLKVKRGERNTPRGIRELKREGAHHPIPDPT